MIRLLGFVVLVACVVYLHESLKPHLKEAS